MQSIFGRNFSIIRQLNVFSNINKLRQLSTTDKSSDETVIYDPISNEPQIPSSVKIRHESIEVKRKRLLYQSRKRGQMS